MTRLVAEALPRPQRLRLLRQLHETGLTDEQIADATSYTTYTAARLLRSLDLAPNTDRRRSPRGTQLQPPMAESVRGEPPGQH